MQRSMQNALPAKLACRVMHGVFFFTLLSKF